MIAELKPYADYKDSGLPWLGQVPAHWELKRAKSSIANVIEQTTHIESGDVYVALENIESWTGRVRPQTGTQLFTGQVKRFQSQDVLFGKLRPYLAKVTRLQRRGVCVGELFVLRPRSGDIESAFLEQLLRAKNVIDVVNSSTFGAKMPRVDWQFLGNLTLAIPPRNEQLAIVRFLDWANGRLDRAIRAKRKVIALLTEQKQVITHRAVTRGTNEGGPLKASGIAWLGDIPQHWEVRRCGSLFLEVVDTGHPSALLLSIDRFKGVITQAETGRKTRASEDRSAYKRVRPGQLAYNLMNAFMGSLGFSAYDGIVSPAYAVAQPRSEIEPRYFHELFRTTAYTGEFNRLSYGIMYERNRLYFERFKLVPALVPPLSEQMEVVQAIEQQTAELNATVAQYEREIELLREYRTCLVVDLVTGKIDVLEAAGRLPEEVTSNIAEDTVDEAEEELNEEETET